MGFVVLTILCAALGWTARERRIIRQRQELLALAQWRGAHLQPSQSADWSPLRWFRTKLGDQEMASILVADGNFPREVEQLQAVFPEAEVRVWNPDKDVAVHAGGFF